MGCFLACFGLSKKRKRPKRHYKIIAADQKYGNYEALDSSLTSNLTSTENLIVPFSEFRDRDKCKDQPSGKNRKKVRFNLNVQIYEPVYQILDNEEEESDKNNGETKGSAVLTTTYPSNYRYYNWKEECDEDDKIAYEEYGIDAYDNNDDEFDDGNSDDSEEKNEVEAYNQNTKLKELVESHSLVAEERTKNQCKSNIGGQNRSMHMHSVMSPVENLTQWKAIKAKVTSSNEHRNRKENAPPESKVHHCKSLLPEIAVDCSLSNWLTSSNPDISDYSLLPMM